MGKIIFYEDRNFSGRQHECMSDCADLHSFFTRCSSIKVESGYFIIYDRPNYAGNQFFVRRGDYTNYMRPVGLIDAVRSCRMVPVHHGPFRLRVYDRHDMGGHMTEMSEDCPNVKDRFHRFNIQSCSVMEGHWLIFEQPNYRGKHYYLSPGEYRRYSDWGSLSPRVGSIRRILDL